VASPGADPVGAVGRSRWTGFAALGVLVPLVPIGAYFWFIHQYSVNVVYLDQWSDVGLLNHWYNGTLTISDLWASHGDHRILFPNLIVIAQAELTHFNVVFEEYLSGVMLVATTVLFVATHRRRSPSTPWIFYTPVTLLLFSLVQYQNTLWGFQMAWYLVTLALAVALFLLDGRVLTSWVFAGAVVAAVAGSFSSLQGLLIWPVGLLILFLRHRPRRALVTWFACALITAAVYFYQLHSFEYSDQTYVFTHPFEALKFFLFLVGGVLGIQIASSPWPVIFFGAVVMVLAVWLVVTRWRRTDEHRSLIGISLICYGILFAATVTEGRAWFALWAQSRYATCGLLILTGCYLAALPDAPVRDLMTDQARSEQVRTAPAAFVTWITLAVAICLQVIFGTGHGLASAKQWSQDQKVTADVIVNIGRASNALVGDQLHEGFSPSETRQLVQMLREHSLNIFSTGAASTYARMGLLPQLTAVRVQVVKPAPGATVKGSVLVDALVSGPSGASTVDFYVENGHGGPKSFIGAGRDSAYGWVIFWNTGAYPNDTYDLWSVAHGHSGHTSDSATVQVRVKNDE
jgi:hypothetical protein